MKADILQGASYAATREPLEHASALPGWCYVSPEWHEREMETLFRRDWLCAGRVEQIPKPGDYFCIELAGHPLIVVRGDDAKVRVHSAVCRHRGAIIAQDEGHCRAFVCPYHSWTYAIDGRLVGTPGDPPPMAGSAGFDRAQYGLSAIRSDTWGGFVFVTFNEQARPLLEWLGDLPGFLAEYRLEDMHWTHKDTYDVECNWKVWLENAFENYHAMTIHRKHMDPKNPQNWEFLRTNGPWEAMYSKRSIVAYSGLPPVPGLSEKNASGLYHIWIQPSVQIILTSSYMKFRQYLPHGPEKLRLYENWTFPRSTVEKPDFGDVVGPAYYEKYSQIVREDLGINPVVQKGMRSGGYRPGRYSTEEFIVHRIANRVIDRVVGPDDARSRARREGAQDASKAA